MPLRKETLLKVLSKTLFSGNHVLLQVPVNSDGTEWPSIFLPEKHCRKAVLKHDLQSVLYGWPQFSGSFNVESCPQNVFLHLKKPGLPEILLLLV